MADTILTPGDNTQDTPTTSVYLITDNFLSEFETEAAKKAARTNLNVLSADDTYTKDAIENVALTAAKEVVEDYSTSAEFITPAKLADQLIKYARLDGTYPFTKPQKGVTPISDEDLTTKNYVDLLIKTCLKSEDKQIIVDQVKQLLRSYAQTSSVYNRSQTYTKTEVDEQLNKYAKLDGTTPFKGIQKGIYPKVGNDLTTKNYVDDVMKNHNNEADPHSFYSTLADRLDKYYTKTQTYPREQLYTRDETKDMVSKIAESIVDSVLKDAQDVIIDKAVERVAYKGGYVKQDGSTKIIKPQKGVEAQDANDYVVLSQLKQAVSDVSSNIKSISNVWKTSGPSTVVVGNIKEGDTLANEYTLQQIMDKIFYGKYISISHDGDYVSFGEAVTVTICAYGGIDNVDTAYIAVNGKKVMDIDPETLKNGCQEVNIPNSGDTEMKIEFVVKDKNEVEHKDYCVVKTSAPLFTLWIPFWKATADLNWDYITDVITNDSTNNKKWDISPNSTSLKTAIDFSSSDGTLYTPVILIPENYNDLESLNITTQIFNKQAFDYVSIPIEIPNAGTLIYKVYKFKQGNAAFHSNIQYTFES